VDNNGKGFWNNNLYVLTLILILLLALVTAGYKIYLKIQKTEGSGSLLASDVRISLAVMPFQNMTNDTLWDVWQTGIQINLITSLSNSEEIEVRQIETVSSFLRAKGYYDVMSITPDIAGSISKKLDADVFVNGNINQAGNTVRINSQVINSRTGESLKSFYIDGYPETILQMIDSLSTMLRNSLIITRLEREITDEIPAKQNVPTNSPEAYWCYIQGQTAFYKNDFPTAIEYFLQALAIDSLLVNANTMISAAYYNQGNYSEARVWCIRSREKLDQMSLQDRIDNGAWYALFFETLNERIKYLQQQLSFDDQNPMTYFNIGDCYFEMAEYENAIPEFEKALQLFHKWRTKPFWGAFYYELGIAYHRTQQFNKEKKLYRKAERDFPDDPELMDQHAWLALSLGDTVKANQYIERWSLIRKEESWSDVKIARYLAYVYDMAGDTVKAEISLRKALSLEPENPVSMSSLAIFLIDYNRNIKEGMALIDKALEKNPDNYVFLHNKGWGLYKLGNYQEAAEILQQSWDLRIQNALYNHKAFLHLQEAKRAASN
jgi:tetratricopeptide (TPR) repeat protein